MVQNSFIQMDYKIIQLFISSTCIHLISKDYSDSKTESWKSKGMSDESIKNPHTSVISIPQKLIINFKKWNLKESVLNKIVGLLFIKM